MHPHAKPAAMRRSAVKRKPMILKKGSTTTSQMGMMMRMAKGSRLERTSFGTPCVESVAACEVRLLLIWL